MEIERFKSKLSKGQLEAMAIDTIKRQLESVDEGAVLIFAKKLKYFADILVKEADTEARQVWEVIRDQYDNMTYTQGATILDYEKDTEYKFLKDKLAERKVLLDTAFKMNDKIFDDEGMEVPKVPIKNYRKDSINVKI